MIDSLRSLKRGKGAFWVTGELWNGLIDALIADRAVLSLSSGKETPSPSGRQFFIDPGSGSTTATPPFTMSLNASTTTASFTLGLVNAKLPSNIFAGVSYSASGTQYVKLQCGTDGKSVNAVTLVCDSSIPAAIGSAMGAAPLSFEVLLYVIVNGTAFRAWNTGNVIASVQEAIRAPKTSTTPGGPAFDIYYTWQVQSD